MARGNAPHLPRGRSRGRQDIRDARRGPPARRARHRRRRRLRRDARPPEDGRADRRPRGGAARARRLPRARRSRRWTSTRSSRAGPRSRSSTSSRTPTCPGSRHEKRWEDVEALLDAGITVISTLNVQHLESLNDVVEQITGIKQQETIPDAVVRRADQIELVDMAPEAIRRRMAHGNIYPAERIDAGARELLPHRQPRRAAGARAALGRRPGRRRAARLPRAPRHRSAVGDTRARRRRSHGLGRTASASCGGRRGWRRAPRATCSPFTFGRRTGWLAGPPTARPPARARRGARRNVPRGRRRGHRRGTGRNGRARSTRPRSSSARRAGRDSPS